MTEVLQTGELKWTRHPMVDRVIPPLNEEELRAWLAKPGGYDAALEYWRRHEAAIRESEEDPLRRGFEFEFWKDFRELLARKDEVYALGGNGPGKTEIGGKVVVETLMRQRGMKVLCVAQNENASKQLQQPSVHKYLPAELRRVTESQGPRRRGTIANVNWSQKGGFTEGTFVLPNRAQCWFKTVEQYERDNTSFEGPEYDLVWIDEPAPIALVDTLVYRVAKRRGKFLFTFTSIHGFDSVCQRVLTGAKVLVSLPMNWVWGPSGPANGPGGPATAAPLRSAAAKKLEAAVPKPYLARGYADERVVIPELRMNEEQVKGVPAGHMPYLMQPLNPAQGVIFLWTHWNLFSPRFREDPRDPATENAHWPALFKVAKGKSLSTVRTRLFGWAEKISGCQFPQFNPNVHVLEDPARAAQVLTRIRNGEMTSYQAGDPAIARSYFLLWAAVDELGRVFVFDESPRFEEGDWVNSSEDRGDGQRVHAGRGVNFYKAYIRRREGEHGQEALRRKGDPRAFATQSAAAQGGESLFELFDADGGTAETAPLHWEPAKVRAQISLDLERINDALAWDENKPISVENEPKLYVLARCQNLIRSMLNWNPEQGSDSPWKDPIDTLRYLFDEPLYYVNPNVPEVVGGRGW